MKVLISSFLMPLGIFFILFILGVFFYYQKKSKKSKRYFFASFVWLFLLSYQPVSFYLLGLLENQYEKIKSIDSEITYVLALGGDSKSRTYETLRLCEKNKKLKVITSGYEAYGLDGAYHTARLLKQSGIKQSIEIENKSRDTMDEALMMKKRVGTEPFYLVTAAYHMPRSMALFRKQGLCPIAAPTDHLHHKLAWSKFFNATALKNNEIVFHEVIGFIWYKFKGYL